MSGRVSRIKRGEGEEGGEERRRGGGGRVEINEEEGEVPLRS